MIRNLLLGFAVLLAATATASAGNLVELSVLDQDSGQLLPQYPHGGDRWIAGSAGHRYAVRLTNTTNRRVLVVLSVDGVNAVSGETADPAQGGYVLAPYETTEISGWRKSLDEVAQFVFTDHGDSYAARTGRPRNVGVIGIAVFEERRLRVPPRPLPPIIRPLDDDKHVDRAISREESANAAAPIAAERTQTQRIGTGHGQREWAPVEETRFVRASRAPTQVSELRYDESRRLIALGILPRPPVFHHDADRSTPRAFPNGFVPDPPTRY